MPDKRTEFGARLRSMRKGRGLTIAQAADALKLSTGSVTNYEAGRVPTAEILNRIALFYGTTERDLLYGQEAPQPFDPVSMLSPEERKLLEAFREMDQHGKTSLTRYAEFEARQHKRKQGDCDGGEGEGEARPPTAGKRKA